MEVLEDLGSGEEVTQVVPAIQWPVAQEDQAGEVEVIRVAVQVDQMQEVLGGIQLAVDRQVVE